MKKMKLNETIKIVAKNSIRNLNEDSLPTDASGIAAVTSRIEDTLGRIYKDSLVEQICDIQPVTGPSGIVFYTKREIDKMTVKSVPFDVNDGDKVIGHFSKEWWNDFQTVTGKDSEEYIVDNLTQDLRELCDTKFITKLKEIAPVIRTITYGADVEDVSAAFMSIIGSINDGCSRIATETKRGYHNYVVCSPKVAAAISTSSFMAGNMNIGMNEDDTNVYLVGKIGTIKIFVDSEASTDYLIVGHKGNYVGDSTFIFAPYSLITKVADDYSTEENGALTQTRYELVRNPLDNTGLNDSKYAKRYNFDFSAMTNF